MGNSSSSEQLDEPTSDFLDSLQAPARSEDLEKSPKFTASYYVAEDWGDFVEKPDAKLCGKCGDVFGHWDNTIRLLAWKSGEMFPREEGVMHHSTVELLENSVSSGCPVCEMILQVISSRFPNQFNQTDEIKLFCQRRRVGRWRVRATIDRRLGEPALDISINTRLDHPKRPVPELLGRSTGSEQAIGKARKRLEHCKKNHPQCGDDGNERILPTRLLQFKSGHLRLCSSVDLDADTRYACLSHCWGKSPIFSLTKERLSSFHNAIEMDRLSRTFQDALQVTVALGLEYLWIDSLCIVQDDEEDWKRESVLMASVYGQSDITIAASLSSDGSQGCFRERKLPISRLVQVHIPTDQHTFTFNITAHHVHPDWMPHSRSMPLSRRAWAYQERRLSPRMICFIDSQLFWECEKWSGPEWQIEGVDPWPLTGAPKVNPQDTRFWPDSVHDYSACDLTYGRDKLVAISGIAKRRQKAVGGTYVAGM